MTKYTINDFRIKVMDCMEGHMKSDELGDWAYDAWFHYSEGEGKDGWKEQAFVDFLLEVSSEWGHLNVQGVDKFDREYLQNVLSRLERYMNVEHQDTDSFI
jgi:hypothetical protein